jgi:hypothetical protein
MTLWSSAGSKHMVNPVIGPPGVCSLKPKEAAVGYFRGEEI